MTYIDFFILHTVKFLILLYTDQINTRVPTILSSNPLYGNRAKKLAKPR